MSEWFEINAYRLMYTWISMHKKYYNRRKFPAAQMRNNDFFADFYCEMFRVDPSDCYGNAIYCSPLKTAHKLSISYPSPVENESGFLIRFRLRTSHTSSRSLFPYYPVSLCLSSFWRWIPICSLLIPPALLWATIHGLFRPPQVARQRQIWQEDLFRLSLRSAKDYCPPSPRWQRVSAHAKSKAGTPQYHIDPPNVGHGAKLSRTSGVRIPKLVQLDSGLLILANFEAGKPWSIIFNV